MRMMVCDTSIACGGNRGTELRRFSGNAAMNGKTYIRFTAKCDFSVDCLRNE